MVVKDMIDNDAKPPIMDFVNWLLQSLKLKANFERIIPGDNDNDIGSNMSMDNIEIDVLLIILFLVFFLWKQWKGNGNFC